MRAASDGHASMELSEFRGLFPITRTRSYLFSGALAPAATPVRAAFESWSDRWMHDPLFNYNNFAEELEALRAAFARLIGTDPSAVAITDNTSRGSNLAVRLLANRAGSNVVVDDTTYPSSIYPWITMSDKELRYVPTDERPDGAAALAERVDAGTVAVTVSHVAPLTGRRHDLAAIAKVVHDQGGLLVVDAAQTTGVVPIDVTADGVDILTTTSMKWLLGPPGVGFVYVRPEVLQETLLLDVGYLGVRVSGEDWPRTHLPTMLGDARRLELGLPSLPALGASRVGIELVLGVGVEAILDRVSALVRRCIEALHERGLHVRTPLDPVLRAGVISFEHPSAEAMAAQLKQRAVDIGGYPWGMVRVDPHAFNTEEDIDRFLEELDRFLKREG